MNFKINVKLPNFHINSTFFVERIQVFEICIDNLAY